jgi:anti-anti-sigma factor
MKIIIQELEDRIVAVLGGEMDTTAALEVEEALQPLFNDDDRDIVIDCTELEYIASSGLRILLSILKNAKAHGNRVILKNVNENIRDVFKLTGFINIFEFE